MSKKGIIIGFALVVALTAGALYLFVFKNRQEEPIKWITTEIVSQNITQSVTATGTIEPVTQVDVGTQVSGILTTLYVDYNSVVKKGQVIAELDKSLLLLKRNSDRNSVATAKSKLNYETANFRRTKALFEKGLIADSDYELALYNYESAENAVAIAENNLGSSETDLGYATIYSPIDGVVLSKSVEEGQTVASSFSTPTLFTIAADLKDMRVIVDVDEADIGGVREGQRATFSVDAFPNDTFQGIITQVRQEATEESNVITYEVVISAENPDLKLKPGLTANVEIFTLDADCATVVPAAALAFTPPTPEEGAAAMPRRRPARTVDNNATEGTIWVLQESMPHPRKVSIGVSNGIVTQVEGQGVEAGAQVITSYEEIAVAKGGSQAAKSPFVQQRGGPRR